MAKCNVVLRKNGESGKCPNEAVKGGQCSVHERKTSSPARSKALEKNKEAGHKIASVVADQRAYEKRNPNSYSYPYWQAKALEEKYPKQTEAYGKKVGSKGKYFR